MDHSEEISNGIEYLDDKYPGWEHKVNLEELRLSSCDHCVLGQLGGYYAELDRISSNYDDADAWARDHGFTTKLTFTSTFPELTEEWKTAIEKCRTRESKDAKIF